MKLPRMKNTIYSSPNLIDHFVNANNFKLYTLLSGLSRKTFSKLLFSVDNSHNKFVHMPFGLKNILLNIQNERCLIYLTTEGRVNPNHNKTKPNIFKIKYLEIKAPKEAEPFLKLVGYRTRFL